MAADSRKRSPIHVGKRFVNQGLKITKHSWRDLKREVQKNAFKILQSKDFVVLDMFRRECLDPYYFYYLWPEKKVAFIEVPKCASSHVLAMLGKARHGLSRAIVNPHIHSEAGLESISSFGIKKTLDLLQDSASFIFTIVREPYDRALSCYLDKFSECTIGDGSYISRAVEGWWELQGRAVPIGRPITFDEFCLFAKETAHIGFDGHWATQTSIIPKQTFPPHYIGQFESLDKDLAQIFDKIGVSPEMKAYLEANIKEPRVSDAVSKLTSEQRALLAEAYKDDFERFGYAI